MIKKLVIAGIVLVFVSGLLWIWSFQLPGWDKIQEQPAAVGEIYQNTDEELKEKIGQMILIGFRGTAARENSYIAKTVKDLKIGGVVLFDYDVPLKSFPRNIENPAQVKKLIFDLKAASATPLFISVDAEGGKVNRLKPEYGFLPAMSAKEMGQAGFEKTAKESEKMAKQLKELGFNMNFAPVLDVDINPNNPVIGGLERSFSKDPAKVAQLAEVYIKEHSKEGIITVAKHFPGHGSSAADSHKGLVDVTQTYQEKELDPYFELEVAGLMKAVMTAHIINKNIDENYPATLSENFISKILREEIGFEGVVISDDMQMGAIVKNYGFEEAVVRAVNAGCDILLLSNNGEQAYDEQIPYRARDIIFNAVKEGKIPKQRIEESYSRIMALKNLIMDF